MTRDGRPPAPMIHDRPATVVSFYSYKGGVGRTFLLANVAVLLARWGWRVLCIDWDLEAPGLHEYFRSFIDEKHPDAWEGAHTERKRFIAPGLVDLVQTVGRGQRPRWRQRVLDLTTPRVLGDAPGLHNPRDKTGRPGPTGALHLLPAGAVGRDGYGRAVTSLDWKALFVDQDLGGWLEELRLDWAEDYDLVLVDSRTGYSDAGGICTVQLPDMLVFAFTANDQSLGGVVNAVRGISTQQAALPLDRHALRCLPVVSRFDAGSEVELAREWRERVERSVREFVAPWAGKHTGSLLPLIRVPHVTRWSYGEPLPVLREPLDEPGLVSYSLSNVAALIAQGLTRPEQLVEGRPDYLQGARARRAAGSDREARRFEYDVFISHGERDAEYATVLARELDRRGVRTWLDADHIRAGDSILRTVGDALEASEHMVLLWRGDGSRWQWTELSAFFNLASVDDSRRLVPALRDEGQLPSLLSDMLHVPAQSLSAAQLADQLTVQLAPRKVAATPQDSAPGAVSVEPADALADYRRHVVAAHARLVPFAPELTDLLLRDAAVELDLGTELADETVMSGAFRHGHTRRSTLQTVLEASVASTTRGDALPRWLVLGDPGAGKTTMARNLARGLAEDASAPLPIFASVTRCAQHQGDLADLAVADVKGEPARRAAIAHAVRQALRQRNGVWVFLDGFDEVPDGLRARAWEVVEQLAAEHSKAVLVVMSRPIAFQHAQSWSGFHRARVLALDEERQHELAGRLAGDSVAAAVLEAVARNPRTAELARNPLLLTLLVFVAREALTDGREAPTDDVRLLGDATTLLLGRGFALEPRGVRDRTAARGLLSALSLDLHRQGGEAWSPAELSERLWEIRRGAGEDLDDAASLDFRLRGTWDTNDRFLEDVAFQSGILGPHDGAGERWRFLHRSLREFLAAERLATLPTARGRELFEQWIERARVEPGPEVAPWAEVFQLYLSLTAAPAEQLHQLIEVSAQLAGRAVRSAAHVDADERLALTLATEHEQAESDGRSLLAAAREHPDAATAAAVLEAGVGARSSADVLGRVLWVLAVIGQPVVTPTDRGRFFSRAGRWPGEAHLPPVDFTDVPAGRFLMGSPVSEANGGPGERPQHSVQVHAFALGRTCVTMGQLREFARSQDGWRPAGGDKQHPAIGVSWWMAFAWCAWIGARLPTEAEWEHACRAGTSTAYSFGDRAGQLHKHAWFAKNSEGHSHPVGEKLPNPWVLYDMHGNVWEWCMDSWHNSYEGAPDDGSSWVDAGSDLRVLRGGGWDDPAGSCRSACRGGGPPGSRYAYVGFRPAWSPD